MSVKIRISSILNEDNFEQNEIIALTGDVVKKIKNPFNFCKQASKMLASYLNDCGYEASVIRCSGLEEYAPNADKRWIKLGKQLYWIHYVVFCESLVLDTTRKQFFPDSPTPFISNIDELEKNWDEISTVPAEDWEKW